MDDCIFCRIVRGEIPAQRVLEDGDILAFEDVRPQAPVHVLIVPRRHRSTPNDLTEEEAGLAGRMILVAARIARERGIAEDGYRLIVNCNRHGGQEVPHLHLHLLGGAPLGPMLASGPKP